MKFGVREICNVVFRAKSPMKIGKTTFQTGQPVIMLDTATAPTLKALQRQSTRRVKIAPYISDYI